jgi:putative transcriptional regulator
MKDNDFQGMMAGLEDAIAYAKGDASRTRSVPGTNVKAVREKTHKTQIQFSKAYHIPVGTLRDWEQGRRIPDAPARTLLSLIYRNPEVVEKLLAVS